MKSFYLQCFLPGIIMKDNKYLLKGYWQVNESMLPLFRLMKDGNPYSTEGVAGSSWNSVALTVPP